MALKNTFLLIHWTQLISCPQFVRVQASDQARVTPFEGTALLKCARRVTVTVCGSQTERKTRILG